MNINMTGDVIQAKRYNMDGNKGGSVYLTQRPDGTNENLEGLEIMKMAAPFEVVDQLKGLLPCKCEIVAQPVAGSGQKMAFKVVTIKPVNKQPQQQAAGAK